MVRVDVGLAGLGEAESRPGAAMAIGPWRYSMAGYDSVQNCADSRSLSAASSASPTLHPVPTNVTCSTSTTPASAASSGSASTARASSTAAARSSPSDARRSASAEVANRVWTTDCSSTSGSSTTWSASSAAGLPGTAVTTVVGTPRSRRARRTSSTSVVVPERVRARTCSYARSSRFSLAANASVSPCPPNSRSHAYDWAMK